MNLAEEREAAIAGLYAARDFLRDNPVATQENKDQFQALYSGAARHLVNSCRLLGIDPPKVSTTDSQAAVEQLIAWATGPGETGGTPFGSAGSRPPFPGAAIDGDGRSWRLGAGVTTSLRERGIRFGAELSTSGNVPVVVPIRRDPVADPRRARFIADIIPEEDAPAGRFAYWQQTVRTNLAAPTARGARKPESIYTGEKVSDEVSVIAHLSEPVNRFDLEDAEMLRQFLTQELEYGLRLALDDQIINGDNTGVEFNGILNQAATEPDAGTLLDTTRTAITSLEELDVAPSHFVFAPATWQAIEDEASAAFSALPALSPLDATARRLHGIPVVVSNAVPSAKGILGDFRSYAVLYRTGPIRVDWSENMYRTAAEMGDGNAGTDFERNMLAFRAELRAALGLLRPAAFLELDMTFTT